MINSRDNMDEFFLLHCVPEEEEKLSGSEDKDCSDLHNEGLHYE